MSILCQSYTNWRAIYINDCSTDDTHTLFQECIQKHNVSHKFTYIQNTERLYQSHNKYHAYKQVKDFEIVCILDGDDWLYHRNVLEILNKAYNHFKDAQIITSHYRIRENNNETNTIQTRYTKTDISNGLIRYNPEWKLQHLKTGFGYLFKSIPESYVTYKGKWLDRCTDLAEMFTVIELAQGQLVQIPNTLYVYNKDNSVLHPESYYNDKNSIKRKEIQNHIQTLPLCFFKLPRTYIIHMKKDTHSFISMQKQMSFIGSSSHQFIDAIDGMNDTNVLSICNSIKEQTYLPNKSPIYNHKKQHITPKSLGLIMSARKALQSFLQDSTDTHMLLLEDDVYFHTKFKYKYHINTDTLKDKDIVYLGCHHNRHLIYNDLKKIDTDTNTLERFYDCKTIPYLIYGAYSVIISRKIAKYIVDLPLDFFVKGNISWDLALNYIRQTNPNYTFYVYHSQLCIPEVRKNDCIQGKRNGDFYTQRKMNIEEYLVH